MGEELTATEDFAEGFPEDAIVGRFHMNRNGSTRLFFAQPELVPEMFFHRTYLFGEKHEFEVHYILFSDEGCTRPSFSAIWEGRYWLLEAHKHLAHARLGDFRLDRLKLAILDPEIMNDMSEDGSADWTLGLFRDVTDTGFPALGPLFEPLTRELTDYDIVFLHGDVLKTGLRTQEMMVSADGRPTAFQDALPAMREKAAERQRRDRKKVG